MTVKVTDWQDDEGMRSVSVLLSVLYDAIRATTVGQRLKRRCRHGTKVFLSVLICNAGAGVAPSPG